MKPPAIGNVPSPMPVVHVATGPDPAWRSGRDVGSIVTLVLVLAIIAGGFWLVRQHQGTKTRELDDAKADARRWVERLGGQVLNLVGTNDAAKQALADAGERYNAAGSQMEQART